MTTPGARGGSHRLEARVCTGGAEGQCTRPVSAEAPVPLCVLHMLVAAQWVAQTHADLAERALAPQPESRPVGTGPVFKVGRPSAVYYLRFGDRIKIGTTTNLPQRLQDVPHDELVAIEPGSNDVERRRHAQFARARVHREWFTSTPALEQHMAALRADYGDPMETWRTATR